MSSEFSVIGGWMIPISRTIDDYGIDAQKVISECQMTPADYADQESRIVVGKLTKLLKACQAQSPDKCFVLDVARNFHPGMFQALGYAMLSSDTLRDGLSRISRYKRVVSNTCTLEVKDVAPEMAFIVHLVNYEGTDQPVLEPIAIQLFLSTITQISRQMQGEQLHPTKVWFRSSASEQQAREFRQFFNCPVEFEQAYDALFFDLAVADKKLLTANPLITQAHEQMLDEFMSRIDKNDLTHLVKSKIYELLALGAPSQAEIASQLGMSLRNLQRRLNEQGVCYRDILEETRKNLALNYMKQQHLTFSEIGYLVGFSRVGNFNRAFKRWTDQTPGEYRAKLAA